MPPHAATVQLAFEAMRTRFEFLLAGDNEPGLHAAGEAAIAEVHACEARLSLFQPGSLVSRINTHAHQEPVSLDGDTFELLRLCQQVWQDSGSAFDVTLGSLMHAWGFRNTPPDPRAAAAAVYGFGHILLDPARHTIRFAREGLALDLGAVGKGHALDLAAAELREAGVTSAFLHAGTSSVLAIGQAPGAEPWNVALSPEPHSPIAHLRDAALGVSAQRGRTVEHGQTLLGHVLDPRTGRPTPGVRAAAAIAPSAALADAWSTALLILAGPAPGAPADLTGIIDDGESAVPRFVIFGPRSDSVTVGALAAAC